MNKIATFLSEKLAGKLDTLLTAICASGPLRAFPSTTSRSALSEKPMIQTSRLM